jgi:hypothetical protein
MTTYIMVYYFSSATHMNKNLPFLFSSYRAAMLLCSFYVIVMKTIKKSFILTEFFTFLSFKINIVITLKT